VARLQVSNTHVTELPHGALAGGKPAKFRKPANAKRKGGKQEAALVTITGFIPGVAEVGAGSYCPPRHRQA